MPLINGPELRLIRRRSKLSVEQIAAQVSELLPGDDTMTPKTLFNIEAGRGTVGCSWERTFALAEALKLDDPRRILVRDRDKQQCTPNGASTGREAAGAA